MDNVGLSNYWTTSGYGIPPEKKACRREYGTRQKRRPAGVTGRGWSLLVVNGLSNYNARIWNLAGKEGPPSGIWNPPEKKVRRSHRERLVATRCKRSRSDPFLFNY
ncbi:unnamed protein product [Linum trigynum]|uniref:Uncharacterized protein n=1 Tax=Linum trigynum TaxID=586398 RepID=A0AAV2DU28_9ROSI